MANASSLTNCHKQKLPWSNNSKKAINVFKHRLEHLSISSWCCLQEFHQRPQKRQNNPSTKLSTLEWWKTVIKLLQGPKNQKCPFPESNQIHEKWQTSFKGPTKKIPVPESNQIFMKFWKQAFKHPKQIKPPNFPQSNKTRFLFSMKPIIQRDTQITFTLSSGWKQGWIMPFMSR